MSHLKGMSKALDTLSHIEEFLKDLDTRLKVIINRLEDVEKENALETCKEVADEIRGFWSDI